MCLGQPLTHQATACILKMSQGSVSDGQVPEARTVCRGTLIKCDHCISSTLSGVWAVPSECRPGGWLLGIAGLSLWYSLALTDGCSLSLEVQLIHELIRRRDLL